MSASKLTISLDTLSLGDFESFSQPFPEEVCTLIRNKGTYLDWQSSYGRPCQQ